MSTPNDIYQDVILDHNRSPHNRHKLQHANRHARGFNALCGDKITVYLEIEDGLVRDVGFEGTGCAISTASASMMTDAVKGKTVDEAEELFEYFHRMLQGEMGNGDDASADAKKFLGKLKVFSTVCNYPTRVKCATLAWHTVRAAIRDQQETVSTE